jgi:hypothetical protein
MMWVEQAQRPKGAFALPYLKYCFVPCNAQVILMNDKQLDTADPAGAINAADDAPSADRKGRGIGGWLILVLVLVGLGLFSLGLYWSVQPRPFNVAENARALAGPDAVSAGDKPTSAVPGVAVVSSVIRVASTLLEKPGGFLHNDVTPPGVLIDNMSNWEYGVLTEIRDSVRSLRNDFSRSQTQSIENQALQKADSDFNFSAEAWFLPAAEEMYRDGVLMLENYLAALKSGQDSSARFYIRADNLRAYLRVVEKRLGSYGQRLAASVGDPELTAALDSGARAELDESGEVPASEVISEATPWNEIDDVFYEARGYSWALVHMMKAIQIDFADVLRQKNAEVSMEQIIKDLEMAVVRKYSPMVLNGHGFGVLANHSLVLASYLGRANAAVIDLGVLLERG